VRALIEQIGWLNLLLGNIALFAGAAAQAAIGMGLNLFTVGILALINPVFVPAPILLHAFLLSLLASIRLHRDIRWRELGLSIIGLVAGTGLAALVLASISAEHLPRLFGALILAGVALACLGVNLPLQPATLLGASAAAGAMGTIAGVSGPPIALVYQREPPARIRAALLPFFAVSNPIALAALAPLGLFGWREVYASIVLMPGLLAGFLAAPVLMRYLTPTMVRVSILAVSAASGLALIARG
jgi:uncharacterized membrane protein YfcA